MVVRLQIRHDIKSEWELYNPVLASGELGIETDNAEGQRIKIGDGNRAWIDLPFIDDKSVHKYADEEIYGNKIFHNPLLLRQGAEIPEGQILNGLADSASKDDEGNVIKDYYQPKIVVLDEITSETDWNTLIKEGIYKVNIDTWGTANTLHGPNEYVGNIYSKGILCVHANQGFVTQVYYPYMESPIVYRNFNDVEWQVWSSISNLDRTIVHTTGDETIAGNKTFSNNVVLNNGNINFNLVGDALILKGGEPFIKKSTDNDTYLSASEGGSIHFRPNGDTSVEGEVVIDSRGIIQGKVTQDGAGNVISDTYARRDQMEEVANNEGLTAVFLGRNLLDNPSGYTEVKEMYRSTFDRAKFTIEGTPTITKDGIASGFSISSYIRTININQLATDVEIKIKARLGDDITTAQIIMGQSNVNMTTPQLEVENSAFNLLYSVNGENWGNTIRGVGTALANTDYFFKIKQKNGILSFSVSNDGVTYTVLGTRQISTLALVDVIALGCDFGATTTFFKGSIDLKHFSITVDGKEVFNGNKTGIDVIKQDNYEVVGSPVITDDGIASGFSSTDYINIPVLDLSSNNFQIEYKFKYNSAQNVQNIFRSATSNYQGTFGFLVAVNSSGQIYFSGATSEGAYQTPLVNGGTYTSKIIINGSSAKLYLDEVEILNYTWAKTISTAYISIGGGTETSNWTGSIDLNSFQIYVNDELVYQPCLRIPYNKTNAGVKISNINYRDRIEDCYTYYNTANYFIIDEENELYQIPYDVPDGHCVIIAQERNGINFYEYNTNLECTQAGSCTANTEFTFSIPYANNQYALSCPYSAKSRTGFTPTVTGDFISKGLIFLSDTQ